MRALFFVGSGDTFLCRLLVFFAYRHKELTVVYADNASTTKLDAEAFEAMKPWLLTEYGNESQLYAFAREPKKVLAKADHRRMHPCQPRRDLFYLRRHRKR